MMPNISIFISRVQFSYCKRMYIIRDTFPMRAMMSKIQTTKRIIQRCIFESMISTSTFFFFALADRRHCINDVSTCICVGSHLRHCYPQSSLLAIPIIIGEVFLLLGKLPFLRKYFFFRISPRNHHNPYEQTNHCN